MEHTERLLFLLAFIAVLGIGTQWLACGAGLPAILLLLAAGVIAGPVTGIIVPETLFGLAHRLAVGQLDSVRGGLSSALPSCGAVGDRWRDF